MVISKELLSEVLGYEVSIKNFKNGYLEYFNNKTEQELEINIHELAHKCKEWALSNGYYQIKSVLDKKMAIAFIERGCDSDLEFYAKTEPESIFKACEWIKDNK